MLQVSPVSVLVVAVPISVAAAKLFVALHLYPVAPGTVFQFQTICVGDGTWVPAAGVDGGLSEVAWFRIVAEEFPQAL